MKKHELEIRIVALFGENCQYYYVDKMEYELKFTGILHSGSKFSYQFNYVAFLNFTTEALLKKTLFEIKNQLGI